MKQKLWTRLVRKRLFQYPDIDRLTVQFVKQGRVSCFVEKGRSVDPYNWDRLEFRHFNAPTAYKAVLDATAILEGLRNKRPPEEYDPSEDWPILLEAWATKAMEAHPSNFPIFQVVFGVQHIELPKKAPTQYSVSLSNHRTSPWALYAHAIRRPSFQEAVEDALKIWRLRRKLNRRIRQEDLPTTEAARLHNALTVRFSKKDGEAPLLYTSPPPNTKGERRSVPASKGWQSSLF